MIVTFHLPAVKTLAALAAKQGRLRKGFARGVLANLWGEQPLLYLQGNGIDPRNPCDCCSESD